MMEYVRSGCRGWRLMMLITCCNVQFNDGSRILMAPYPFTSHTFQHTAIGAELKLKGHEVFILTPESYPQLEKLERNFQVIAYTVKHPDIYSFPEEKAIDWMKVALTHSPVEEMRINVDGFTEFCTNPLEDTRTLERLRQLNIDLAIVDGFPGTRCLYILMHKLGIPYVSMTTWYEPWVMRNPALPSFAPFQYVGRYTEKMTFIERARNLLDIIDWTVRPGIPYLEDELVRKYLPGAPSSVTLNWLAGRSILWFIDTDVLMDYPRPRMPNEIDIGGLTTRPARPLVGEFAKFADDSVGGMVIMSFGTTDIQLGDEACLDKFVQAFARLRKFRFVWRYSRELDGQLADLLPNTTLISKWIPQNDLLGHINTKLLITHCGANSQFEGLYHAIPQLCFPVFGDQPHNARRMTYLGYGRHLDLRRFTTDEMVEAITDLIENSTYKNNIATISKIFRSRHETPLERAVRWVEYAIKYGGKHLRSHALDMPWYEFIMFDILLLVVILPAMVVTSLITCCFCVCFQRRKQNGDPSKIKLN